LDRRVCRCTILEDLADLYATPAAEAELMVIFKEAQPGSKPTSGKWAGVRANVLNSH